MKNRLFLAFAVIALNLGIVNLASADPQWCQDICAVVRCAAPTTCGIYNDNGQVACGCH